MIEQLQIFFQQYGYAVIFLGAFLESIIITTFFVPGILIVLLGGYFAQQGELSLLLAMLMAVMGVFFGNVANYWAGHNLTFFYSRRFSWGLKVMQHEKKSQELIQKYGMLAIFYSHLVGYFRTIVTFTAGVIHFPFMRFLAVAGISSLLWGAGFTLIGFLFAKTANDLQLIQGRIVFLALGLLVVLILLNTLQRLLSKVLLQRTKKIKNKTL